MVLFFNWTSYLDTHLKIDPIEELSFKNFTMNMITIMFFFFEWTGYLDTHIIFFKNFMSKEM
jgi:hypothetical protein